MTARFANPPKAPASPVAAWDGSRLSDARPSPTSSSPPNRTPKSCLRTPRTDDVSEAEGGYGHTVPTPPDYSKYYPQPPREEVRHHSPNKKVITPARPTFVLGREKSVDPTRPAIRRQPTPYHTHDEPDEVDAQSIVMEEHDFVTPRELMEQLEHFLERLNDVVGADLMKKHIMSSKVYELHVNSDPVPPGGRVFGVPVSVACATSPCLAFFADQQQRLPLLVFTVVEEIYARDAQGVFRTQGEPRRIERLVRRFDKEPYGEGCTVEQEAIPDLCGLLIQFLDQLPEPIIHPVIEQAFFSLVLCGENSRLAPDKRVDVARLLLRLLPAADLSLLVYLISFLGHLLRGKQGSITSLAKIFRKSIAARPVEGDSENAKRARRDAEEDAEEVVKWLLVNWESVMHGLMEDPVLALNPFERSEPVFPESPGAAPAHTQSVSSPSSFKPVQSSRPSPQPQRGPPGKQRSPSEFLDALTGQLTGILNCADSGSRETLKQLIHRAMQDVRETMEGGLVGSGPGSAGPEVTSGGASKEARAELASCLAKAEADKAVLEKKLKAAQRALNAALTVSP